VDSYFSAFGSTLSTNDDPTTQDPTISGADPLEKGKGKKKGLRTPSDPI
jgi:hypothetical protein